jgi:bifunctional non-homologous end joining protein LigD
VLPTKSDEVRAGSDWLHEVKYDGYRMMLIREQDRVRLISRGGHDWTQQFPLVVESMRLRPVVRNRSAAVLAGEGAGRE